MSARDQRKITSCQREMKELNDTIERLFILAQAVENNPDSRPLFQARFARLEEVFASARQVHKALRELTAGNADDPVYATAKGLMDAMEDKYYKTNAIASKLGTPRASMPVREPSAENYQSEANVNLPRIKLKTFSGDPLEWRQFYDLFKSSVHDVDKEKLPDCKKFWYLLSCLSGPPLNLIKHLPLVDENYEIARNTLVERYDNKRLLASAYLRKLIHIPRVSKDYNLRTFYETIYENYSALKGLQITNLEEFILFEIISKSLDEPTLKRFELENDPALIPTLEQLINFLLRYCKVLDVTTTKSSPPQDVNSNKANNKSNLKRTFLVTNKQVVCPVCHSSHTIYRCPVFSALTPHERRDKAKSLRLCFNCLKPNHLPYNCTSKQKCLECNFKHNTLLHIKEGGQAIGSGTPASSSSSESQSHATDTDQAEACHATVAFAQEASGTILGTAVALIKDNFGNFQQLRILIDSGAQTSFITSSCVQRLGLPIKKCNISVSGLSQNPIKEIRGMTSCCLKPRNSPGPLLHTEAIILQKITSNIPSTNLPPNVKDHFKYLILADNEFDKPAPLDFLLAADLFVDILRPGHFKSEDGFPSALSTIFGFVIVGKYKPSINSSTISAYSVFVDNSSINANLQKFWEVEEPPQRPILNPDDIKCDQIYDKFTYRDLSGRFYVPMPLKDDYHQGLGDSHSTALCRLRSMERRLSCQPSLREAYNHFMNEYQTLGHMTEVSPHQNTKPPPYLIPHHCVLRPNQDLSKIRVVFDGSARTADTHRSLNQILLPGKPLQKNISDIILQFRSYKIVFTADICKMYRQINIIPEHRFLQHILWRESPSDPIREYELNTVTYGLACAPYLALRTLQKLAQDQMVSHPNASQLLLSNNIFVDDILAGGDTEEGAIKLGEELIDLLRSAGMELGKWASNSITVLQTFTSEKSESSLNLQPDNSQINILGLKWNPTEDCFLYKTVEIKVCYTKRFILSQIARVFDPLGWVSPAIFMAKCLMQELWKLNLDWDQDIPSQLREKWARFCSTLCSLSSLKIVRHVLSDGCDSLLIGFSDASALGYAACVYLRSGDKVSLLIAKSKVSPLKTLSIPRLELCGALLLAKLLNHVYSNFATSFNISRIFAFCDSTVVLAWLKTPPHLLKIFEANRVVEISNLSKDFIWGFVNSCENPADVASRGCFPDLLVVHDLWWHGPPWLLNQVDEWPSECNNSSSESLADLPGLKSVISAAVTAVSPINEQSPLYCSNILLRFSTLSKLQRVTAWCFRFISSCKNKTVHVKVLTPKELDKGLEFWITFVQSQHFYKEINEIRRGLLPKNLRKLSPYVDSSGLLRVGGRLTNSSLPYYTQHPILLPKTDHFTDLLIDHYHKTYLHAGPRALQSIIQQRYWIISARSKIRGRLSKCLQCFKFSHPTVQPLMGNLPSVRVTQARPFQNIGIDFGGPFLVRETKLRKPRIFKCYLGLFICLTTKCVHLEVVTDLTTEAFLSALDRFTSRRGLCKNIYSDCGTNFVGAHKYLIGLFKQFNLLSTSPSFLEEIHKRNITWHFGPPASPHFGGIWEAGIKSVKYHLKRVVGDQVLTLEAISTLFCKIEAILNSRPLCDLSSDPSEFNALTPAHFLIGSPLVGLPQQDYEEVPLNRLNRYHLIQKLSQGFWKKWHNDYLLTLQQRQRWTASVPNIKIGQIVLLREPAPSPMSWTLGRVEQLFPGEDGAVRVVDVRTSRGTYRRPVVKLAPLPFTN